MKLSELIGGLSSQESRELMVKAVCVVAESDGCVKETEHAFFDKVLRNAAPDLEVPPVDQWHDLMHSVRGAFLEQAR
jgi:tellurite resistance protein